MALTLPGKTLHPTWCSPQCSNYQGVGTASGGTAYGPNMVLGLQLIGAQVIYENGQVSFGAQTTYDNAGYCGSSIMTGGGRAGGQEARVTLGATIGRQKAQGWVLSFSGSHFISCVSPGFTLRRLPSVPSAPVCNAYAEASQQTGSDPPLPPSAPRSLLSSRSTRVQHLSRAQSADRQRLPHCQRILPACGH